MNDRALLELAAKAAGIEYAGYCQAGLTFYHRGPWNSLTDDSDALRLAVQLGIRVCPITADGNRAYASHDAISDGVSELHNGDPYAATRRAIVRAAAEIGKAMP